MVAAFRQLFLPDVGPLELSSYTCAGGQGVLIFFFDIFVHLCFLLYMFIYVCTFGHTCAGARGQRGGCGGLLLLRRRRCAAAAGMGSDSSRRGRSSGSREAGSGSGSSRSGRSSSSRWGAALHRMETNWR